MHGYWAKLSDDIQTASHDTGNIRKMYEGIKQATGVSIRTTAPLKSKSGETITDRAKLMSRWVEHYLELYSRQNIVTQGALDSIQDLPVLDDLDSEPTKEELSKAIKDLANGKAAGVDCTPPEIIKCGEPTLLEPLHKLLCLCWREGHVPQDMRNAKNISIVTLYKSKGDRSDCNNYRGISLLSTVGKVFARVVLSRLQILANRIYPESQCGFRSERSTIDMIFSVRQLQEKCREQHMPLYIAFIDLTKAFDLVSRSGLFELLRKIGCPPRLLNIIVSFHEDMKGMVNYDGENSEPFTVKSGVKQGCVLAPTLFGIFVSMLLSYAFKNSVEGIHLHTRSDGKLFNLARLKAKTKVQPVLIREMLFADDAAVTSHSEEGIQQLFSQFAHACNEFGLTISIKKTKVMGQDVPAQPSIYINQEVPENTDNFTYLGSTITSNLSLDKEIDIRIAKASATMSKLSKKVWDNNKLSLKTKIKVYQACVISTLLYSSETWTTYTRQENRLESFHLRCLRRILRITWEGRITNTSVLEQTDSLSMHLLLCQRRLRWLGHVHRMKDGRIPKDILYCQLAAGHRQVGRPTLRFRDVCKRDMRTTGIDHNKWEAAAEDRATWRSTVRKGIERGEERRRQQLEEKRIRRKERQLRRVNETPSNYICITCGKDCHARIGLMSHSKVCF